MPSHPRAPPTPPAVRTDGAAPSALRLSGNWTAGALGPLAPRLASLTLPAGAPAQADGAGITALDSAGAWLIASTLSRLRGSDGAALALVGLPPAFAPLQALVRRRMAEAAAAPAAAAPPPAHPLAALGRPVVAAVAQGVALLQFVGECAIAVRGGLAHPRRLRIRPVLFNIRSAGVQALPIVGLLAFLLGVVVAYQSADTLRRYGGNLFIADIVGLSMVREFAPLITAIIIAGRSGSAFAAQIGTMAVTEEIDALRTLGIPPLEMLVLPKVAALVIALPLLTVFADVMGVLGGLLMAHAQLGVGYAEFIARLARAVSPTAALTGLGKAPVFAAVIALIGCFQGFRTHGGAESVGRQTTRAVVQSIFGVIVADGLFSVAFSALDL